jgi:hypothetical protein
MVASSQRGQTIGELEEKVDKGSWCDAQLKEWKEIIRRGREKELKGRSDVEEKEEGGSWRSG